MSFAPYVPPAPKASQQAVQQPTNDDATQGGVRRCIVCDDPASIGIGVFPVRGIKGDWYCAAHAPASGERLYDFAIDDTPNVIPFKAPEKLAGAKDNILRLENMASGVVAEIDLTARDKRTKQKGNANKINWREQEAIEASLPPDELDELFDALKLQQRADAQNREAVRSNSTARYCRCGALAETAYRINGNPELWRCNVCIQRAEEWSI